jgi:hypothetical protein
MRSRGTCLNREWLHKISTLCYHPNPRDFFTARVLALERRVLGTPVTESVGYKRQP